MIRLLTCTALGSFAGSFLLAKFPTKTSANVRWDKHALVAPEYELETLVCAAPTKHINKRLFGDHGRKPMLSAVISINAIPCRSSHGLYGG